MTGPRGQVCATGHEDRAAEGSRSHDSTGMRAVDAGPLKRAHQLEGLGFLHMAIQGSLGNTWNTTIKVLGT